MSASMDTASVRGKESRHTGTTSQARRAQTVGNKREAAWVSGKDSGQIVTEGPGRFGEAVRDIVPFQPYRICE